MSVQAAVEHSVDVLPHSCGRSSCKGAHSNVAAAHPGQLKIACNAIHPTFAEARSPSQVQAHHGSRKLTTGQGCPNLAL